MSARRITPVVAVFVALAGCAEPQRPANACNTPADCPPNDNPCLAQFCDLGACTTSPIAKGTPIAMQSAGDCSRIECDGKGQTMSTIDDTDLPVDSSSCTTDVCNGGIAANKPVTMGTACADNGGTVCDTKGACVACNTASDCPGTDSTCAFRLCDKAQCVMGFAAAGTPVDTQTAGDCKVVVCDGSGNTMSTNDDTDVPNDNNACTSDVCTNGAPQNPNMSADASCAQNGGKVCDGNGACVECNAGSQCSSGVCAAAKCQPPACDDGLRNGTESDVDCGGSTCLPCSAGDGCASGADCYSGVCQSMSCGAPIVTATVPGDGEMSIPVLSDIAVVFSGSMIPATLVGQTVPGPCSGSIQASTDDFVTCLGFSSATPAMSLNDTIATFTPSPALSYGSTYAIRVTTAAKGIDGSFLGTAYKSTNGFTTESAPGTTCNANVVISQIFGGGGNASAPYKNDFIELHNRGASTVDLSTWSVQYASAAGSSWLVTNLTGSIAPGGYYLVHGGSGGNIGNSLPSADATGMTNMSATAGKVALVNSQTALNNACPTGPTIVDFVGFGATTCFEGTGAAPAGSNTMSISRLNSACTETNDNKLDFMSGSVSPKNTLSAPSLCACLATGTVNESGAAAEIDFCNIQAPSSMTVAASATTPAIFGRVLETGVTEAAGANGAMIVQVGYGPTNINPSTQSGWTFFPTTYTMQVGSADEYSGTFTAPMTSGTYRYAVRASLDGTAWTYCDLNGAGSMAGAVFEVTQLPVLNVTP